VSGGPDSTALLLLAHAALPGQVEAVTVDHGLRPESAQEAELVAAVCAALDVPHAILAVSLGAGNVQEAARKRRYGAMLDWAGQHRLDALATAHHADDQAETLVMRLNRGSGLGGLSGIRQSTIFPPSTVCVVRPLLRWRRSELGAIVEQAGAETAQDPSNRDADFERVRVRDALREAPWLDPAAWSRSAEHLQQLERALDFAVENELAECAEEGDATIYFPYRRGAEWREPFWMRAIETLAIVLEARLDADQSARMVDRLRRGEKVNIGGLLAWTEQRGAETAWLITREPPRRTG
jgi:tRNA(Ile)-lysidine synthase